MRKVFRLVMLVALVAAMGAVAKPAEAVNLLTYSWVVPCDDQDGVSSDETLPVTMPTGKYVAVVTGACTVALHQSPSTATTTPCGTATTGPVPCVGVTTSNLPAAACWLVTSGVDAYACGGTVQPSNCWATFTVTVSGECLIVGAVGIVDHDVAGPMHAKFMDAQYSDNLGYFVVTVTWTPLP